MLSKGKRGFPTQGRAPLSPHLAQGSHLEFSGIVPREPMLHSWMESDLQSALDKGDMSQEVVAVSTVTALWDHVLPLPGVTFVGTD